MGVGNRSYHQATYLFVCSLFKKKKWWNKYEKSGLFTNRLFLFTAKLNYIFNLLNRQWSKWEHWPSGHGTSLVLVHHVKYYSWVPILYTFNYNTTRNKKNYLGFVRMNKRKSNLYWELYQHLNKLNYDQC